MLSNQSLYPLSELCNFILYASTTESPHCYQCRHWMGCVVFFSLTDIADFDGDAATRFLL